MKKIVKIVCTLLVVLLALSACACDVETDPNAIKLPVGYRSLFQFESYDEFKGVEQTDYFGKYTMNTDPTYVKNGKGSVKLEPSGFGYGDGTKVGFKMFPWRLDEVNRNLKKAERIVFELYNTSNEVKTCYFTLGLASSGSTLETPQKSYSLLPQAWTKCVYDIEYASLSYVYDFSNFQYMTLLFEGLPLSAPVTAYYLDNVMVKNTEAERAPAPIELSNNEICDFEKDYQQYMTYVTGFGAYKPYVPQMSINNDKRFVTSGDKSLKLKIPHGTKNQSCYVRILFCEALMKMVNLAAYENNYDIVFDLYNDSDSSFHFESSIRDVSGPDVTGSKSHIKGFTPTPRTWVQCRISLSEANAANPAKEGEATFVSRVKSFELCYGDFAGSLPTDDKTVYIDNIRLEMHKVS